MIRPELKIMDEIDRMIGRLKKKGFDVPPGKVEIYQLKIGYQRVEISFKAKYCSDDEVSE